MLWALFAFCVLLGYLAVSDAFKTLEDELATVRTTAAIWSQCLPPRSGERLVVTQDMSTVTNRLEYTCVYHPPMRRGVYQRLRVQRVGA